MVGGGGFGIQDDHRELTFFPDAGDLLNASFFMEPGVSPVHSPALVRLLAFTRKTLSCM